MSYSASGLERFTYCSLNWWRGRNGARSEGDAPREGHAAHARKGRLVALWQRLRAVYVRNFDSAFLYVLVASAAALVAIDLLLVDVALEAGFFLLVLAFLCLLSALVYLLRAQRAKEQGDEVRLRSGVLEGELVYSDLDRPAEALVSEKYDLTGRPDYMVRRDGHLIPVEVKTGKTPERPHPSHMIQAAAYALLVKESTGDRPPYAVVSYPDRNFEVSFDEAAERQVLVTLLRMRLAETTGEVHRSHQSPARCLGCSRREGCPERLA
ncbi:MAG TPA: PD-(D/E)XK nuclease family protein [Candidatus Thermoplasmatota archaeon]|nr:PD-(D/E)XK nuclease family protein [Candidatus Thermoplasmatota archaeon]